MLSRLNFPFTQNKSRFSENNFRLKQKNSRLACYGNVLANS